MANEAKHKRYGGIVTNGDKRLLFVISDFNWLPADIEEYKGARMLAKGDNVLEAFGEPDTTELYMVSSYE